MKPGTKVVCVDATFKNVANDQLIREGDIYTVRWYGEYTHYIDGTFMGVRLAEIDRGADPGGYCEGDMPFRASRFRPVVSPAAPAKTREVEKA